MAFFGLRRVLLVTLASLGTAALLLGVAPTSWMAVVLSSVLFGAGVMLMSALLSLWSSYVFPERPSTGFSAVLFVFGVGLVAGPAVFGAVAETFGLESAFLSAGVLMLFTTLVRPRVGPQPDAALRR